MCRLEKKEDGSIDFFYQGKDGETKSINCGLVLFGTGRKPIVWDMGLEVSAVLPPLPACIPAGAMFFGASGTPKTPLPPPFWVNLHQCAVQAFKAVCSVQHAVDAATLMLSQFAFCTDQCLLVLHVALEQCYMTVLSIVQPI